MPIKILIGSSSETLPIAQAVQNELRHRSNKGATSYFPVLWNQNVISKSKYTIPELLRQLKDSDCAIFIFGKDDVLNSRGQKKNVTRDNVIFEFGLATGVLGLEKSFIIKSDKATLPSDFSGLSYANYREEYLELSTQAEIGSAVTEFEQSIKKILSHSVNEECYISWDNYYSNIKSLCKKISKSPRLGGFRFDIILGISRGGVIVADLISRVFCARTPLASIWADYYTEQPEISFDGSDINESLFSTLSSNNYKNILIVDDITRTGQTITKVALLLKKRYPKKNIKTAVVYVPKSPSSIKDKVDYYAEVIDDPNILMPYSKLDCIIN